LAASLEADARSLAAELAEVDGAMAALAPELDHLDVAEAELAADRADLESRSAASVRAAAPRAAEARGELAALRAAADRDRAELARLENRLASLEDGLATLDADLAGRRVELDSAARVRNRLGAALADADSERAAAAADVAAAEAASREADAEVAVWAARVEALVLALDHVEANGGGLDDVDGVVGTLADLVVVEPGWEAAFEAAAGEALGALVVDGVDAARRALAGVVAGAVAPAVLPLGVGVRDERPGAPPAAEPVRAHVSPVAGAPPAVEPLLDVLLARAVAVGGGWEEAIDTALAHPSAVVVTHAGDRFAPGGWRVGGGGPPATRAALADARRRADRAADTAGEVSEWLEAARRALAEHTARHDARARALADHDREANVLVEAVAALEGERRDLAAAVDGVRAAIADQVARLASAQGRVVELEVALPELEAEEAAGAEAEAAVAAEARRLHERAEALSSLATEVQIRRAALEQRRDYLIARQADVESRLGRILGADREAVAARQAALERAAACVERLARIVEARLADVESRLVDARAHRQRQAEVLAVTSRRLDDLRGRRADAERRTEEVRERSRRAELDAAQAAMRLEAAVDAVRRELDVEPEAAESAPCPELGPGTSAESRARELERELRLLGPVNPLASEELAILQERHAFLEGQLEDVRTTRRELGRVIRAVDAEIVQLLSAAYADVADNFVRLFETLFPGGQGRLRLTDADDLLESGIDIEARPAGKNVRRLSLLSGGERSLCALAFLFAVFRSRPSPFYLLDEVEAALDDVNLHRFLDLLGEFRQEAQLVVVTHQKRTMEAADCLYGVTMQAGGTSRVVSERLGAVRAG
ncbi:MAG TPA: AAA family ATPase, partial [Acidimicrobiales bacterium]|nr:AAA family ATPase [Acidimicrobiales bacterium]